MAKGSLRARVAPLVLDEENATAFTADAGARDIASAQAPFIYFDAATVSGVGDGVAHITLEGIRHMVSADGQPLKDFVVTAHLRMSLSAAQTLRTALNQIDLISRPVAPTRN